jgi:hypothetical protein
MNNDYIIKYQEQVKLKDQNDMCVFYIFLALREYFTFNNRELQQLNRVFKLYYKESIIFFYNIKNNTNDEQQ